MMSLTKTLALGAALTLVGAPAFAQSATTLGGGGDTRANGGVSASTTGRSESGATSRGAASGEVGSRASNAAKGNDPTGTNGATNNRY